MPVAVGDTAREPAAATLPVQAPAAAHADAYVEVQLSVVLPPASIAVDVADKAAVGNGGVTATVVDAEAGGPFGPEHSSE